MKNKDILIPETRGAKSKYDFVDFIIGETRSFENTSTMKVLTCAKTWVLRRNFDWKFRCYTIENKVFIVRIS